MIKKALKINKIEKKIELDTTQELFGCGNCYEHYYERLAAENGLQCYRVKVTRKNTPFAPQ